MTFPSHGPPRSARRGPRRAAGPRPLLLAAALGFALAGLACQDTQQPFPRPFPPNIEITAWPPLGSTLDPSAADSVVLTFSRPMDPRSLRFLKKASFLFPLTVDRFEGRWNADSTRVVFGLTRFPRQPGALYEAVFAGLRTADGDLYNLGPYTVSFRTRGASDLFPFLPPPRVASRQFCRRASVDARDCARTSRLTIEGAGMDSVGMRFACTAGCETASPVRLDLYRKRDNRLEWLGFDLLDTSGARLRSVRWPQPPALASLPAQPGLVLDAAAQTADDATRLTRWQATTSKSTESPTQLAALPAFPGLPGLQLQLVFSECGVLDLDYAITSPGGKTEAVHERWWLYTGVGLVRREVRVVPDDGAEPTYELQTYDPDVASFLEAPR